MGSHCIAILPFRRPAARPENASTLHRGGYNPTQGWVSSWARCHRRTHVGTGQHDLRPPFQSHDSSPTPVHSNAHTILKDRHERFVHKVEVVPGLCPFYVGAKTMWKVVPRLLDLYVG